MKIAKSFSGELAVYVSDLDSEHKYTFNSATPNYLASVTKLFVLIEVMNQVEQGKLRLDDIVVFRQEDIRDGAGEIKRQAPGTKLTIDDLIEAMVTVSDNSATDLLIGQVGIEKINQMIATAELVGIGEITTILDIRRRIYAQLDPAGAELSPAEIYRLWTLKSQSARARQLALIVGRNGTPWKQRDLDQAYQAYYQRLINSATLDGLGNVFERLSYRDLIGPAVSNRVLERLLHCRTGPERIKAGLPTGVPLAHKTGTQYQRICDAGVVDPNGKRPYVIAICAKNFSARASAEQALARISKAAYALLGRHPPTDPTNTGDDEMAIQSIDGEPDLIPLATNPRKAGKLHTD